MRAAPGSNSRKSPSCFAQVTCEMKLTPVTLPPGRLRLATRPSLTGSPPVAKTIGTVVVAALAASAAGRIADDHGYLPAKKISHQKRQPDQFDPRAERYSIATFWPSTKPASFRPWRNAAQTIRAIASGDPAAEKPNHRHRRLLRPRRERPTPPHRRAA